MPNTVSTSYCSSRRTIASPQLGPPAGADVRDSAPSGVASAMRGAYRLRWVSDAALIERAEELLAAQYERVGALLPEGCAPFDAHTHLGLDEDGHTLSVAAAPAPHGRGRRVRRERLRAQRARPRAGLPRAQRPRARVGRRGAGPAVPVRAAEPRRGSARRGRALPRPRARAASSCTRARRRSASTIRSSRPSSRWRTSDACRCSSMPAAACRRACRCSSGTSPSATPTRR